MNSRYNGGLKSVETWLRSGGPRRPKSTRVSRQKGKFNGKENFQRSTQDSQGDEGEKGGDSGFEHREKGNQPQTGGRDRAQRGPEIRGKDSGKGVLARRLWHVSPHHLDACQSGCTTTVDLTGLRTISIRRRASVRRLSKRPRGWRNKFPDNEHYRHLPCSRPGLRRR